MNMPQHKKYRWPDTTRGAVDAAITVLIMVLIVAVTVTVWVQFIQWVWQ